MVENLYEYNQIGKYFRKNLISTVYKIFHTGEKCNEGNQCGKACSNQIPNLNVHKRTHTEEKSYEFIGYEKAFINCSLIKTHRDHALDTNHVNVRNIENPSQLFFVS